MWNEKEKSFLTSMEMMQECKHIQGLFLDWIRHQGVGTYSKMKVAGKNLLSSYYFSDEKFGSYLFYPLMRYGLIEFCGKNRYQVSPPVVFYYPKAKYAVVVNADAVCRNNLKSVFENYQEDLLKIVRIKCDKKDMEKLRSATGYECIIPDVSIFLQGFPSVAEVVSEFDKSYNNLENAVFLEFSYKNNEKIGLYTIDDDGQQLYLRTSQNADLKIPLAGVNPDGRALARSYVYSMRNESFISYKKADRCLTVSKTNALPILVDRVLRLACLYEEDGIAREGLQTTYFGISPAVVKELERILGTKVYYE